MMIILRKSKCYIIINILLMQEEAVEIKNTRYFQLINQFYKYALYITSGSDKFTDEMAYLDKPNQSSLGQVWQVVRVDPDGTRRENCFEIVHARSTLVLTKTDKQNQVKLRFGKWENSQLFYLEKVDEEINPNVYRFRNYQSKDDFLYYDKLLKVGATNLDDPKSHWLITPCLQNQIINQSCYLENAYSSLSIDVPAASQEEGCRLIQYPFNNRFNQRFNIYKEGNYFRIVNCNSKLLLTASKKCKEGQQIIQKSFDKSKQQDWIIQYQGRNLYVIRAVLNPNMMIGIKEKCYKEITPIIITSNEEYALWKIVGKLPGKYDIHNY